MEFAAGKGFANNGVSATGERLTGSEGFAGNAGFTAGKEFAGDKGFADATASIAAETATDGSSIFRKRRSMISGSR